MKQKYLILFSLAGLIISLDQLSKWIVRIFISEGLTQNYASWISLMNLKTNGFAFGLVQRLPGSLQHLFFVAVPVFALLLIIMIFIKLQGNEMLASLALTSILGGAVGNLIDRVEFGHVLDWVQIKLVYWESPPFNIADVAILVGVGLVFLNTILVQKREKKTV